MKAFNKLNATITSSIDTDHNSFNEFTKTVLKTNNLTEVNNLATYQNVSLVKKANEIDSDISEIYSKMIKCNKTIANYTNLLDSKSQKEILNGTGSVIKSVKKLNNQLVYIRNGYKTALMKIMSYVTYPFETLEKFRSETNSLSNEANTRYNSYADSIKKAKNELYEKLIYYKNFINSN
jgi:hypothetical protein